MRNSLARRQRHRRQGGRKPRSNNVLKGTLIAIPIILFSLFLLAGAGAAVAAVGTYQWLAQGLPDPSTALDSITFTSQTVVYDRSGNTELAKLGSDRRDVVKYADIPQGLVDATTSAEDKTFWSNAGFDPAAFVKATLDTIQGNDRGASTITQQLVRARLLPQSVLDDNKYIRKAKEIIQSIRLTQAYQGTTGKQTIMEDYLNQNFYGNRSYGVAAAAQGYWNKSLSDLDLAQLALLAGIPKSPTQYDLLKNAVEQTAKDKNGKEISQLVVPSNTAIYQRRNYILQLMLDNSGKYTLGTYTADQIQQAMSEPIVLTPETNPQWIAPQFVWQVRDELGQLICGSSQCDKIDTGGYKVYTTLNYSMQKTVEKWLYAAAVIPNNSNQVAALRAKGIPASEWAWIRGLGNENFHNAAAGIIDYRTGEVLAYSGSANPYSSKGNRKFQPAFDVLGDGFRQPGSSIKPIDYAIGIEDKTLTAATMFMDVTTNFAGSGQAAYIPTQADKAERGPVRLRSALEFSLNIPAIKAGFINGLDHQFQRTKDFGITYPANTYAVASESIGTLLVHPIDMISAYGALADGGVLMPRHTIQKVIGPDGEQIWPQPGQSLAGKRVVSKQTAYIITDILAGNTQTSVNPFWAKWRITDGVTSSRVRPAAYKTGTTEDTRDVLADGFLPMPSNPKQPGIVVGVWMGNSDNSPTGSLSLDSSAPLWSAIMSEVSKGMPIESFARTKPSGLVTATVDAFTGMKPGATTRKTVTEMFLPGTAPTSSAKVTVTKVVDAATGLLWQDGCAGPQETRAFIDYSKVDAAYPAWQRADIAWQARAARGSGTGGGLKGTHTSYFYGGFPAFFPFGASWGGSFAPTKKCDIVPITPPPSQCVSLDPFSPCPSDVPPTPTPIPSKGKP